MKQLFLSNIIEYVKARLDELSNNDDALLVASDQAVEDLEKEIEAVVVPSVRKIHLDAPNILLRDGLPMDKLNTVYVKIDGDGVLRVEPQVLYFPWEGGTQDVTVWTDEEWRTDEQEQPSEYATGNYVCFLEIPNDFLRLITLKANGWKRPIQTFVGEDSVEYRKQQNKYLRGTPSKPIGVLTHGASGSPVAELFTCTNNAQHQVQGQYYPEPDLHGIGNDDKVVYICQPLEYPCLHQITANVLRGLGRVQEAMMYEQMAVQPFRIDPDWARLNPIASERFNVTQ